MQSQGKPHPRGGFLMSEVTINRRQAVRAAAGVAAGGLLVTGLGVSSAAASDSSDLLGSWLIKHQATDPASDEVGTGIASFIADGVLVTNDIKPAGPISTGSWEWTSSDKFQATVWSGVQRVRQRGHRPHQDHRQAERRQGQGDLHVHPLRHGRQGRVHREGRLLGRAPGRLTPAGTPRLRTDEGAADRPGAGAEGRSATPRRTPPPSHAARPSPAARRSRAARSRP